MKKSLIILFILFLYCQNIPLLGRQDTTKFVAWARDLKTHVIPDNVFSMKKLKHIEIRGLECCCAKDCWIIQKISPKIRQLKELETLVLTVSSVERFPKELATLKKLKHIDLTDSKITLSSLDVLVKLKNLESLSLFGCGLTTLPKKLSKLKKLHYIGLTGNNLQEATIARLRKALPTCEIICEF